MDWKYKRINKNSLYCLHEGPLCTTACDYMIYLVVYKCPFGAIALHFLVQISPILVDY